jgi:hypothetical protein
MAVANVVDVVAAAAAVAVEECKLVAAMVGAVVEEVGEVAKENLEIQIANLHLWQLHPRTVRFLRTGRNQAKK